MKRGCRTAAALLTAAVVACGFPGARALGSTNYILGEDGVEHVPIPLCYTVTRVIDRAGTGDFFKNPQNMFIDKQDNLYLADAGNNRIVKFSPQGEKLAVFTAGGTLKEPGGAYAVEDGSVYIADKENERIVHVTADDRVIEEFVKPVSDLLDESLRFNASNVAVGKQGYIYIMKGQNFLAIDHEGQFKGYVGATKVGFSFSRMLVRLFASAEQKKKLVKAQPDPYQNFTIADDGVIYAVASNRSGQIRKINMVGDNLYLEQFYGERTQDNSGAYVFPNFISIAVAPDGIVSVLEQYSKQVYQYDQEGNMINAFGGEGEVSGRFVTPVSICADSQGQIYVADSTLNNIQVFTRTAFSRSVYQALDAYGGGDYAGAYDQFRQVLAVDANYAVANEGIAKCLLKLGRIEESMEQYRAAGNRAGYGAALVEYRYTFIQRHFTPLLLGAAVLLAGIIALVILARRYAAKVLRRYYNLE